MLTSVIWTGMYTCQCAQRGSRRVRVYRKTFLFVCSRENNVWLSESESKDLSSWKNWAILGSFETRSVKPGNAKLNHDMREYRRRHE